MTKKEQTRLIKGYEKQLAAATTDSIRAFLTALIAVAKHPLTKKN